MSNHGFFFDQNVSDKCLILIFFYHTSNNFRYNTIFYNKTSSWHTLGKDFTEEYDKKRNSISSTASQQYSVYYNFYYLGWGRYLCSLENDDYVQFGLHKVLFLSRLVYKFRADRNLMERGDVMKWIHYFIMINIICRLLEIGEL